MGQRNVQPGCNTAKLPFQNTYQTSSEAEVKRDEFFAVVEVAIVQQDLHVLQSGLGCLALRALHGRSRRLRELLSFRKFNCQLHYSKYSTYEPFAILIRFRYNWISLNGPFSASFLYFRLFLTDDSKQIFYIKVCRWLDSNCGPLVSEATVLPIEPQPLPKVQYWL